MGSPSNKIDLVPFNVAGDLSRAAVMAHAGANNQLKPLMEGPSSLSHSHNEN
jgi:hypothetical protein